MVRLRSNSGGSRLAMHGIIERAQSLFGGMCQNAAGHENIGRIIPDDSEIMVQVEGQDLLLNRRLHLAGATEQQILQGVGNAHGGLRHGRACQ